MKTHPSLEAGWRDRVDAVRRSAIRAIRTRLFGTVAAVSILVAPAAADATTLSDLAASMQPGEWRELTTSGFNQGAILVPPGNVGTILEYTDKAQRNPVTKKIWIIGCARGTNQDYTCSTTGVDDSDWIEYDEATNSWRRMPSTAIYTHYHGYNHAAMDPATGDYYYYQMTNRIAKYSNGQLSTLPGINSTSPPLYTAMEYFPERNALVLVAGELKQLYTMVLGSNSWTSTSVSLPLGQYHNIMKYSARHKLLFIAGGVNNSSGLLKMDAQGVVTRAADAPTSLGISSNCPIHVVDPVTGNFLVFSTNGTTYEYNPVSNAWSTQGTHPLGAEFDQMAVAVGVPEYGVIFATKYDFGRSKVYLYKHAAGTGDTKSPAAPIGMNVH